MRRMAVVIALGTLAACAPESRYVPTMTGTLEHAPTREGHDDAVSYAVLDGTQHGDVQVAVVGVERLRPRSAKWSARALHVRMTLHNDDGGVWTVEPLAQQAMLDGQPTKPLYALCDGDDGVTTMVLFPGDRRTVDLFYRVPKGYQAHDVNVAWRIGSPDKLLASNVTAFQPTSAPAQPATAFADGPTTSAPPPSVQAKTTAPAMRATKNAPATGAPAKQRTVAEHRARRHHRLHLRSSSPPSPELRALADDDETLDDTGLRDELPRPGREDDDLWPSWRD